MLDGLPNGGVLALCGEPGIGKSRLTAEFTRLAAEQGARVLCGGARERTGGTAYAPLAQALLPLARRGWPREAELPAFYRAALGQLVPDWRTANVGDDSHLVIAEGLLRLLSAVAEGGKGSVLVVEDLHWADPDTLAVLDHVAREAWDVPVLLVTTTRATAPVVLDRLDQSQQLAMLTAILGEVPENLATLLCERAEGVPLVLEEVLADLVRIGGLRRGPDGWTCQYELVAEATAPSIDGMVAARLDGLPAEALAVAAAAAVLDNAVSWRDVAAIAALDVDTAAAALSQLASAQLLTGTGRRRYRFHHGLIRESVLACAPPSLVRDTAERAAKHVESTMDDPERAARLYEHAGNRDEAARLHTEAGRRWLAEGALRSAEVALRCGGDQALDALAECLGKMGRFAEALDVATELVEQAAPGRGDAHCAVASYALEIGNHAQATEHLDLAERAGGAAAQVAALRATLAFETGNRCAATELAAKAVQLAEASDDPHLLCSALLVTARVKRAGDPADATPVLERLIDVAPADWRELATLELGVVDSVTTMNPARLQQARRAATERGALHMLAVAELNLSSVLLESGDVDQAQDVCDHAAHLSTRYQLRTRDGAVAMRAMLAAVRGNVDQAQHIARGVTDSTYALAYEVYLALCTADSAAALAILDRITDELNHWLARPATLRGMHVLLRAARHADPTPARQLHVDGIGSWTNRGLALLAEAVVAGAHHRRAEATALAARAYADLSFAPTMAAIATTLAAPQALAAGWGTPQPWLQAAHGWFTLLGNDHMRRHCESILRAARLPVSRRGRGTADVPPHLKSMGVTSREMDVLVLVADNLTNTDIAARLSLSRRTIDTHVSHLLAKTGTTGRAAIASLLKRSEPNPPTT